MQVKLFRFVETVRSSYWFVPSIMAAGATVLGVVAVWLDAGPGTDWLDSLGWYQKSKPEAAREMLSAIASSMITVAGVVFSITIVAIAFAAAQYGPRVLTNFMSDRGNQLTLGTFIGTFVYSLVVLRTIHSGDDSEFVPQFAVLLGIFLALCSIAVLIYFVHHVPNSIHVNSVIARIGKQLVHDIDRRKTAGSAGDESDASSTGGADDCSGKPAEVQSDHDGYVEAIDEGGVIAIACRHGLLVRIGCAPGEFSYRGRSLMEVWPADKLTDECSRQLHDTYAIGTSRTPTQDLLFLVDELVEITARALSTGVNDPFTAITCVDWLGAAAVRMAGLNAQSDLRRDDKGKVRVIIPTAGFETLVDRGFGRARPYVAGDANVARHLLGTLSLIARSCSTAPQVRTLRSEADGLMATAETLLEEPQLAALRKSARTTRDSLDTRIAELEA